MAETVTRNRRMARPVHSQPCSQESPNWLFTCLVCGEPITFDEPLVVWTEDNAVRVAHCRCEPARCSQKGNEHASDR